jgi:hypothetical protein
MSRLRRGTAVVALATAAVLGMGVAPALAAFDDTTAPRPLTITTTTVQPPTELNTTGTVCTVDGRLELHLSWKKSSTARVTSYRVNASTLFGLITYPLGTVPANRTSVVTTLDSNSTGYSFSVTTVTDYGWTADSAQTRTFRC